jgi:hypothetical protein
MNSLKVAFNITYSDILEIVIPSILDIINNNADLNTSSQTVAFI